jgi:hypothetical protein
MIEHLLAAQPLANHRLGQSISIMLKNVGAVSVPANALVEVTGVYTRQGGSAPPTSTELILEVTRPTSNLASCLASNGPVDIEPGAFGPGFFGPILPIAAAGPGIRRQCRPTQNSFNVTAGTGPLLQLTNQGNYNLFACDPVQPLRGFILTGAMNGSQAPGSITDPVDSTILQSGQTLHDPYGYLQNGIAGDEGYCVYCYDRWLILGGGGSSRSCDFIAFEILSVSSDRYSAVVEITHRPCGCNLVPEEVAGIVTVYDELECHLSDEEPSALIGRKGTARYMTGAKRESSSSEASSGASSSGSSSTKECLWMIDGLCCP